MLQVTKIFYFETAHAIHGYAGQCRDIHGHSYQLEVTVAPCKHTDEYLPAPGFVIDFKELKKMVNEAVVKVLDHRLVLSANYIVQNQALKILPNLLVVEFEPTAENLLRYIQRNIQASLPAAVKLVSLKLYETKDSFAEWIHTGT